LHSNSGLRIAVLVNDFGAVNIDRELVAETRVEGDIINLSNGCICCTIRGDLLQAVLDVAAMTPTPEYILVETSGVSDPLEVALTFTAPQVAERVHIDSIITVIDAEHFDAAERASAVLAMNQVGMADLVILNKVDMVSPERLAEVERQIAKITPRARVFRTTHANVPPQLLLGVGVYDPARLHALPHSDVHVHGTDDDHDHDHDHTDHSTIFHTWSWSSAEPLALKAVERLAEKFPSSVYRVKGTLYLAEHPDQRMIWQGVGQRFTLVEGGAWQGSPSSTVVAIGTAGGVDADALTALMASATAANQVKSVWARLTQWIGA
jgi:G3E family GTPase